MTSTGAMNFNPPLDAPILLPATGSWPATRHQFDEESVWAIRAALAARRPLLIRGEPGIGKSQLARAAAVVMRTPLLSHVINARAESDELLYSYDAVSRLARAQLLGTQKYAAEHQDIEDHLAERHFVRPGCLWWAFDWTSAALQARACYGGSHIPEIPAGWEPAKGGCVILIDEIDKADTDVPNSLLESLGNTGFYVPYLQQSVALPEGVPGPLVVITTNEERELPAAFLRRCMVYQMAFPNDRDRQIDFLISRGRVHFKVGVIAPSVYTAAARQLLSDRDDARRNGLAIPGFAEYRDLLTALADLCPANETRQNEVLSIIGKFALRKNPEGEGA
ncbi:MAG: AAA family ATPase [Capsulimonadaceae bacterium]